MTTAQVPDGYFVNSTSQAEQCNSECLTCSGFNWNCTACSNLTYYQGSCLASCPTTLLYSASTAVQFNGANQVVLQCTACLNNCNNCLNATYCIDCTTGFYLNDNNECVNGSACQTNTYPNSSTLTCAPCVSPCLACTGYDLCTSCVASYYLNNQSCTITCPDTFFANNSSGTCDSCTPPCRTCTVSTNCPSQFYPSTTLECLACSFPCLTCTPHARKTPLTLC